MKKNLLLIFFFLLCIATGKAQSAKFAWKNTMGDTSNDVSTYVHVNDAGFVYTVGTFEGTVDFFPGPGVFNLTSEGLTDIFITKYDPSGAFMWAKQIGGPLADVPYSISTDPISNLYISGSFSLNADFDPGPGSFRLIGSGGPDIFFLKLDFDGMFQWAQKTGGMDPDAALGNTWDKTGHLYTTGYFGVGFMGSPVDFNPHPVFSYFLTSLGVGDIFVSKFDMEGNHLWSNRIGGDGQDISNAITTTPSTSGNIAITGSFAGGGISVNTTSGLAKISPEGKNDVIVSKLNKNGGILWVKHFGGREDEEGKGITMDMSENVYITGTFSGTVDFNPGLNIPDTFMLTAAGTRDIFVVKLSSTGAFLWAKSFGAAGADCAGTAIKLDAAGNIYFNGIFDGTIDFNPSDTVNYDLTSAGAHDIFIAKLTPSGNFIWAKRIGGAAEDNSTSMAVEIMGNIYTSGSFGDSVDFDPAYATAFSKSVGKSDAFVHKMLACTPSTKLIKDTICRPFTLEGITYSETGFYTQTITGTGGCEEFVTLDIVMPKINDTVSQAGIVLTSSHPVSTGIKYQWINCRTGLPIPGATGQSYFALGNDPYAVTLFDGHCRDTSECINITSFPTDIDEYASQQLVQVFPNPSTGTFVIQVDEKMVGANANIFNMMGQKVRTVELSNSITNQSLQSGVYLIEIIKGDQKTMRKLVVN